MTKSFKCGSCLQDYAHEQTLLNKIPVPVELGHIACSGSQAKSFKKWQIFNIEKRRVDLSICPSACPFRSASY